MPQNSCLVVTMFCLWGCSSWPCMS